MLRRYTNAMVATPGENGASPHIGIDFGCSHGGSIQQAKKLFGANKKKIPKRKTIVTEKGKKSGKAKPL